MKSYKVSNFDRTALRKELGINYYHIMAEVCNGNAKLVLKNKENKQ